MSWLSIAAGTHAMSVVGGVIVRYSYSGTAYDYASMVFVPNMKAERNRNYGSDYVLVPIEEKK